MNSEDLQAYLDKKGYFALEQEHGDRNFCICRKSDKQIVILFPWGNLEGKTIEERKAYFDRLIDGYERDISKANETKGL